MQNWADAQLKLEGHATEKLKVLRIGIFNGIIYSNILSSATSAVLSCY